MPHLSPLVGLAARPFPLLPVSLALSALTRRIARAHPGLMRRLGPAAGRRFLIDAVDLPIVLLLHPARLRVTAHRRTRLPVADASISGPLSAFLAMLHGAEDGDALFFSRDLNISGETEAVLALRNALDDAELDLTEELAALSGPLAGPLRRVLALAERRSGVALHRADLPGVWT
jgi:predicted lipid carrier protein YhbT